MTSLTGDGFDDYCRLEFPLVFAAARGALQERARLKVFLHQIGITAIRTLLGDGPCPCDEIAIRITIAPVECLAPLRATFHHFALRTFRALHTYRFLLHILAGRIIATRSKLAKSAIFLDQIIAALRAFLIKWNIGFLLRTPDLFGGFAVGVTGAGIKCPESAFL